MRSTSSRDVLPSRIGGSGVALVVTSILVVSLFASGCVGPALTEESYRDKAVASLEQLHATIAVARSRQLASSRSPPP